MDKLPEECITKYDVKWTENGIDLANEGNHSVNLQIFPMSETLLEVVLNHGLFSNRMTTKSLDSQKSGIKMLHHPHVRKIVEICFKYFAAFRTQEVHCYLLR